MKQQKYIVLLLLLSISTLITSCSLDSSLNNGVNTKEKPISDPKILKSIIIGAYANMSTSTYYGRNLIINSEARSQYAYANGNTGAFSTISSFSILSTNNNGELGNWYASYEIISSANRAIENDLDLRKSDVSNYVGQAYIIRALAHYDLLRFFGQQYLDNQGLDALGIPYQKKFGEIKQKYTRESVKENRNNIYEDLDTGIRLLKNTDLFSREEINLIAAYGLKSRIALFFANFNKEDFHIAKENAELALDLAKSMNIGIIPYDNYIESFQSDELQYNSIFELAQSAIENNGASSLFDIYNKKFIEGGFGTIGNGDIVTIFKTKEDFFSNETQSDIRSSILGLGADNVMRNTGKYPSRNSNIKMMRFEEILLNYIEAAYEINNGDSKALDYMNQLLKQRIRNNKDDITSAKQYTSLNKEDIKRERTRELMFEGFNFEDLMRWRESISNPSLLDQKINYGNSRLAFPIPLLEIKLSEIPQNKNY